MDPNLGLSMDLLSLMCFCSFVPGDASNRKNSGSEVLCIGLQLHHSTWCLSLHWRWTLQVPPLHCRALYPRSLPLSPGSLSPPRSLEHVRWTSIAYLLRLSISIFSTGSQGFSPPPSLTMTDHVSPSPLCPCFHSVLSPLLPPKMLSSVSQVGLRHPHLETWAF